METEEELAKVQGEIEKRYPRISAQQGDKKEAQTTIQTLDYEIKSLKLNKAEVESEIEILLSQKAKLLLERVYF